MKNFPIEHDGKTYWISRSVAVGCYIYARRGGRTYVLANKRGPGLPNNVGKWNVPMGFLDFDETFAEAACREVFEETGLVIKPEDLNLRVIDSRPDDKNQVVLVRYSATLDKDPREYKLTNKNAEPGEVEAVKWIDINKLAKYDWVSERHMNRIYDYATLEQLRVNLLPYVSNLHAPSIY